VSHHRSETLGSFNPSGVSIEEHTGATSQLTQSLGQTNSPAGIELCRDQILEPSLVSFPFLVPTEFTRDQRCPDLTHGYAKTGVDPASSFDSRIDYRSEDYPGEPDECIPSSRSCSMLQRVMGKFMADHRGRHISVAIHQAQHARCDSNHVAILNCASERIWIRAVADDESGRQPRHAV
jgi:hypothetical protein